MTTLTTRLQYPSLRKTFLLEVTAGQWFKFWTVHSGSVWYTTTAHRIVAVRENGVALTEGASASLNAGEWWWEQSTGKVYVRCTGSVSPYTKTLQGIAAFYFSSDQGRVYNGIYYEPRIESLPTLTNKVEYEFGSVGVLSSGSITLNNQDGFFDAIDLEWDSGGATLLLGVDDPLLTGS